MKEIGGFIALALRHNPSAAYISLDENGWANVDELIVGVQRAGRDLDRDMLDKIVAADKKNRFAYNKDKTKIRANQGHSIAVDVGMEEKFPPDVLYHGTAEKYIESIRRSGIKKQKRNFVHLSLDEPTARTVGARHGQPVVLKIDAKRMSEDGYKFFISANGVWQTEFVPFSYVVQEIR
ncbi:MAG: RNA 2'-phosphotransferase [Clostridia bacterium]|nr:RNA 2'-phosphotransferase [Clostridia bacterium]